MNYDYGQENADSPLWEGELWKTSTLIELVKLLGGNTPLLNAKIDSTLKQTNGKYKDARFIVLYGGFYIYIGTGGDEWKVCRVTTEFFEGLCNGNTDIWLIENGKDEILKTIQIEASLFKEKLPSVCILACRPNGDGFGAVKAINSYVEQCCGKFERMLWLHKHDNQKRVSKDVVSQRAKAKAAEIKKIIDDYLV